jgi:peptidoglycan hydrolase FlgJ
MAIQNDGGFQARMNSALDATDLNAVKLASKRNEPEAIKAAAQQFEALFMNMMMKSMRDATPKDSMFDSEQSRMYTSMLDQKLSENFAKRGVGLADALVRQLTNNAGLSEPKGDATPMPLPLDLTPRSTTTTAKPAASAAEPVVASEKKRSTSLPEYVRAFRDKLTEHAKKASELTGIPANFMLGQAALESGWGKREIKQADGSASHNLFGVKAGKNWSGKTVNVATTEYVNGVPQKKVEKFRAYDSYAAAFEDYAKLLSNNPRYKNVVANAQDAHNFARGLQRAGYATDPNYAQKLSSIIQRRLSA